MRAKPKPHPYIVRLGELLADKGVLTGECRTDIRPYSVDELIGRDTVHRYAVLAYSLGDDAGFSLTTYKDKPVFERFLSAMLYYNGTMAYLFDLETGEELEGRVKVAVKKYRE